MSTDSDILALRVRTVLHPKRPRLAEARAVVAGVTDPEEAWRALAVWGLVPGAPTRDDGAYRTGASLRPSWMIDGATLQKGPGTVDGAVALASDPSGIAQAALDAQEWLARLGPWGAEAPTGVHWRTGPRHTFKTQALASAPWAAALGALDAVVRPEAPPNPTGLDPRGPGVRAFLMDLEASRRWARASTEGLRVPEGHPPQGSRFGALPDPFGALLALWDVGYGVVSVAEGAVVLFAPTD